MEAEFLLGNQENFKEIEKEKPKKIFSEETIEFLSCVAEEVFRGGKRESLPDLLTYGFWCRRAHLQELKKVYAKSSENRLARGISLHFAPGNIPTQFAYTAAAGLLAGNCTIVRLSSKKSRQEEIIQEAFAKAIEKNPVFRRRIFFLRYEHNKEITDELSRLCQVRVIWGSDASVREIRKSPIGERAVELVFAARDSAAVFSAKAVLETEDLKVLCRGFYNDTYLNDQNACSSPHILYWLGEKEENKRAQMRFWKAFQEYLTEQGWQIQEETAVRKYEAALKLAVAFDKSLIQRVDNRIVRIQMEELKEELWEYMQPGGFFLEGEGKELKGLLPVLSKRCQTLSFYGVKGSELADFVVENAADGVDRIVPVGHTLDFELTWDGIDMIEGMSRKIKVMNI